MRGRIFIWALAFVAANGVHASADSSEPVVFVRTEIEQPGFSLLSASVRSVVLSPRLVVGAGNMFVRVVDNDEGVLSMYLRRDPRSLNKENAPTRPQPDGQPVMFSTRVFAGMRFLRVVDNLDNVLLEADLGPAIVDACESGVISATVCGTFDSDGDGCNDEDDPEPLVPETEPPVLTGKVTPDLLWPPNHKLRTVDVTLEVTDNCDVAPSVVLKSVASSDPEDGVTEGDRGPDILGAAPGTLDLSVELRAERWPGIGPKDRTYTLTYEATDRAGNVAELALEVVVPRSLGSTP